MRKSIRSGRHLPAIAGGVLMLSVACAKPHVRLESRLVEASRQTDADITVTPEYFEARPGIKRVALRAPDSCANQTLASSTGAATAQATVMATACGVEMAELERALTRAGFSVFSWKSIANMVSANSSVTPVSAAKQLGAQVLFQVNSLERAQATSGQDARWERNYFKSNPAGTGTIPLALSEEDRAELKRYVEDEERAVLSRVRPAAALDVNAVMVDTGQSIWFYQNKRVLPITGDTTFRVLAVRHKKQWIELQPLTPRQPRTSRATVGEVEAVSVGDRASSEQDATYTTLLRELVADFVTQFTQGKAR